MKPNPCLGEEGDAHGYHPRKYIYFCTDAASQHTVTMNTLELNDNVVKSYNL